jgi:carbonic anhydrase
MIEGELPEIKFDYKSGGHEILNNGHTVQINYVPGSTITINDHIFELKQFHFHSPSENTIEGDSFPMEVHFVHADVDGNLAVVALMFKSGRENIELEKAWTHMPTHMDEKRSLTETIDANALLPGDKDYYRFNGSLTTPPCSEGVWWLVLKQHESVSNGQITKFKDTMHHSNNRPVQAINGRIIIR